MIQRIQSVYLLLALIYTIVCMCLPVGAWQPEGMGLNVTLYNLWTVTGEGKLDFAPWALFAILLVSCPCMLAAIFSYKNRMRQARLCVFTMLLMVGWYAAYAIFSQVITVKGSFSPDIAAALPLVNIILLWLARRGIMADERLVRSMDRIR